MDSSKHNFNSSQVTDMYPKGPLWTTLFLWWSAGPDTYFMSKAPMQNRVKYAGIGGIVFCTCLLAASVFAFFQLTQINEWEQIKMNNITTALISAALIVGMSLIMDDYIGHLYEALIPYPSFMQIR